MCIWAEEKKVIEMKACGTLQTLKSICSLTKSNGPTYLLMSQLTFTNLGKKLTCGNAVHIKKESNNWVGGCKSKEKEKKP